MKRWYQHFFSHNLCSCKIEGQWRRRLFLSHNLYACGIEGQSAGDQRSCGYLSWPAFPREPWASSYPAGVYRKPWTRVLQKTTLQMKDRWESNVNVFLIYVFPEMKLCASLFQTQNYNVLSLNFHIHVSLSYLYFPRYKNLGIGNEAKQFLGILKPDFRYSARLLLFLFML